MSMTVFGWNNNTLGILRELKGFDSFESCDDAFCLSEGGPIKTYYTGFHNNGSNRKTEKPV